MAGHPGPKHRVSSGHFSGKREDLIDAHKFRSPVVLTNQGVPVRLDVDGTVKYSGPQAGLDDLVVFGHFVLPAHAAQLQLPGIDTVAVYHADTGQVDFGHD